MYALGKLRYALSQSAFGRYYRFLTKPRIRAQWHLEVSMAYFKKEYDAYWATISQDRSKTTMVKQFDEVLENGYAIVPDFLSPDQLEAIRQEVWALPGFIEGRYTGDLNFTSKPADGLCALGISDRLPEAHRVTIGNENLHDLARALYGPQTRLSAASILNKHDPTKIDSSIAPHWDDWRVRLKAFIYLTDVDESHAPTLYIKGSTRDVPWRFEKDYASVFLPIASSGGSWWPVEALGLEKVMCTGKAGTMVIFDALGIHAGTQLKEGIRVMLMSMYTTHLGFTHRAY